MKSSCLKSSMLLVILLFAEYCSQIEAQKCQPSGKVVWERNSHLRRMTRICFRGKVLLNLQIYSIINWTVR
ncbi:hypothetical protein NC653_041740 [Populus alba x Populus x berolinensis]|uniref:Secreted protein n=1 Tax=Populus alba x Populus x berolinensis TaxID=444605 RepID=A0AAD6L991_9ROSI|nr:hypothetical protein NC653_041740 [Populus alba x Populus x berolinensis]